METAVKTPSEINVHFDSRCSVSYKLKSCKISNEENKEFIFYGISLRYIDEKGTDESAEILDISTDMLKVYSLMTKMAAGFVTTVSFYDIIYDFLTEN